MTKYIISKNSKTLHKGDGGIPSCTVKGHSVEWKYVDLKKVEFPYSLCRSCFRDQVPPKKKKQSLNGKTKRRFPKIIKVSKKHCLKCQKIFVSDHRFNKICNPCNLKSFEIYVPNKTYSIGFSDHASLESIKKRSNPDNGS